LKSGQPYKGETEELSEAMQSKERRMFGLRMREGVELDGENVAALPLGKLLEEGLLTQKGGSFQLTSKGRLVADSIAEMLA
jgi:coproporphyrinogen III oxidase-like Fe-S oxidoreductase